MHISYLKFLLALLLGASYVNKSRDLFSVLAVDLFKRFWAIAPLKMQRLALGDGLFPLPPQTSCVLTIPTATSTPRKSATRWRFYSRIRNRSRRSRSWRNRPGCWRSTTLDEDGICQEPPPPCSPICPRGGQPPQRSSLGVGFTLGQSVCWQSFNDVGSRQRIGPWSPRVL